MTQEEALKEAQAMFPEIADVIAVERQHRSGCKYGNVNTYYIWDHSNHDCRIVSKSNRSWEHVLAIAKSGNEDCWPETSEPWEDEVADEVDHA